MHWVKDKNFQGVRVEVDNTTFTGCHFSAFQMGYTGGPFAFDGCTFADDCVWALTGAAALTLSLLGLIRFLGYDLDRFIPSHSSKPKPN